MSDDAYGSDLLREREQLIARLQTIDAVLYQAGRRAKGENAVLDAVDKHEASRDLGRQSVWMRLLSESVDGVIETADLDALRVLRACLRQMIERVDALIERAPSKTLRDI